MPIPAYPSNLIPRPFAANGTFQLIPDAKAVNGRASWQEGFPVETQLPLANGGIAPSRPDFNGIFYMLSALAYWQQAGGMFMYSATQDYNTPAMVFYNNMLWFCKAPNGPDTTVGVIAPDSNTDYWISFLDFLASGESGGSTVLGVPVGTIIMYYGVAAPEGFFACDGAIFDTVQNPKLQAVLNGGTLPDLRGLFIRGYDSTGVVDPNGTTRAIGSKQNDTIQNITARWDTDSQQIVSSPSGAVYYGGNIFPGGASNGGSSSAGGRWYFDASRVARTSSETRPSNASLLYCIKHD